MLGCQSAPRAAPGFEVNAPAYLYAHTGARNFDEARAILRARIATDSGVQCSGLWRVLARLIGLLSNRDPAGQHRNNDRNDDFSHELFYRVVRTFPTDSTGKSLPRCTAGGCRRADLRADQSLRQSTRQSAGYIIPLASHEPIEDSS
jgi:hypothetical protein